MKLIRCLMQIKDEARGQSSQEVKVHGSQSLLQIQDEARGQTEFTKSKSAWVSKPFANTR